MYSHIIFISPFSPAAFCTHGAPRGWRLWRRRRWPRRRSSWAHPGIGESWCNRWMEIMVFGFTMNLSWWILVFMMGITGILWNHSVWNGILSMVKLCYSVSWWIFWIVDFFGAQNGILLIILFIMIIDVYGNRNYGEVIAFHYGNNDWFSHIFHIC